MPFEPEQTLDHPRTGERRRGLRRGEDLRLRQRDRELEAARVVSEALFEHLHPDELIKKALHIALDVVEAESGSILIADPESKQFLFRHSIGDSPVPPGTTIQWDKGIAGAVFHSRTPIVIADVKQDGRHLADVDTLTHHVTRDLAALPLKRWEGEPIGVLEVLNKRHGRLNDDDVALLTIVSAVAASSIERARLFHEAKLAEVARVLGDVSHDIKNLLMPVLCGAGLLSDELKDLYGSLVGHEVGTARKSYELCTELVDMLQSSSRRIQTRVKEIADCVKGLSAPPRFAPCRVADVVDSVMQTLRWLAEERHIALQTEGFAALPEIVADEDRLFHALYNLVNNAIPEVSAGGWIRVSGRYDPEAKRILLSVADTGRGMPPEIRESLFTSRTRSQKEGGTGLGTKIVKDIVDAHGGRISVESEVGAGTTFFLSLPVQPPLAGT